MSPEEVVADALAHPPIGGDPNLMVPGQKYRVRPEVEARFILGMLRAEGYDIVRRPAVERDTETET